MTDEFVPVTELGRFFARDGLAQEGLVLRLTQEPGLLNGSNLRGDIGAYPIATAEALKYRRRD